MSPYDQQLYVVVMCDCVYLFVNFNKSFFKQIYAGFELILIL